MKTLPPKTTQPPTLAVLIKRTTGYFHVAPLAIFLSLISPMALAQTEPPSTGSYMLQTTLGLGFVLLLLLALMWVMKRAGFNPGQRSGSFYKVLASTSLGPRERIVLVEIGDTWLVLGMTQHSINTLHSMPKGSIDLGNKEAAAQTFAGLLDKLKQTKQTTE